MNGPMDLFEHTRHLAFGDLAGVWSVLEPLGVAAIVDDVVGARRSDGRVGGHLYRLGHRQPRRGALLQAGLAASGGPRRQA